MALNERGHKTQWLKIGEALRILNTENIDFELSTKHMLKNALLFKENSRHKGIHHKSEKRISIYFYTPQLIHASVFNEGGDLEVCISHITFSGYIPLSVRYINNLLNTGTTSIKNFSIHPSTGHKPTELLEIHEKDFNFYWDANNLYKIHNTELIMIDESNIEELFIHQSDLKKLLIKYKNEVGSKHENPVGDKNDKRDTTSNGRQKYSLRINRYKRAAANCLARAIWTSFPEIHPAALSSFWPFSAILIYQYEKCIPKGDINKDYFTHLQSEYTPEKLIKENFDRIQDWIKKSSPIKLTKTGRPDGDIKKSSEATLDELNSIKFNDQVNHVLKRLILSIEQYNSTINKNIETLNLPIDLLEIDKKILANSPELKTDQFWRTFLDKHELLFDAPELQQTDLGLHID